jgi:hypothetical protein
MREGLIFWEKPFRVAGPVPPEEAAARLKALFQTARFGMGERIAGAVEGDRVRAWRRAAIAASDVVRFEGRLVPDGRGAAIEGTVRYNFATRLQFTGTLAFGLFLACGGLLEKWRDGSGGNDMLAVGGLVSAVAVVWIYASSRMKGVQIEFIRRQFAAVLSRTD